MATDSAPFESVVLLRTKLGIPRTNSAGVIPRPRLQRRLIDGTAGRLTLVSAPAGFGKSTLVAGWLASQPRSGGAWLSLETADDDPDVFWAYVVAALEGAHPTLAIGGTSVVSILNALATVKESTVLVLDDYHVVTDASIHEGVAYLIEHLPHGAQMVMTTRFDPPLPLARWRARGDLTEVRAPELRFTADEISEFLNGVLDLGLSPAVLSDLEDRTEGWITALKLSAMATPGPQGLRDGSGAFRAGNGYVAEYVVDEVLRAEHASMRRFLLATSTLDRLSGPLCAAVTEDPDAPAHLADLVRRNVFVVALDDDATWYRFHPLFREILQGHARRVDNELLGRAHARASLWYQSQGSRVEAVEHALAGGDVDRAADLLEAERPEKNRSDRSARWLAQARTLPGHAFATRPALGMGLAWALLNNGEPEAAEGPLSRLEAGAADGSFAADLAAARGYQAQMRGDVSSTLEHARRALDLVPESDHASRATGTALVALSLWGSGELEEAYRTFDSALAGMRRAGLPLDALRGTFVLGDIRAAQGRLRDAASIYEGGLREAAKQAQPGAVEADELYLGLVEVHCEWAEVERAEGFLHRLQEVRAGATDAGNRLRWFTALAETRRARGDLDGALAALGDAHPSRVPSPLPELRSLAAMKARVHLARGALPDVLSWVDATPLPSEPTYRSEFDHLTLARVLLALARGPAPPRPAPDPSALLEQLAAGAARGERRRSHAEALALLALARYAVGDRRGAMDALAGALHLAEAEGYVRLFADEGTPMRDLLRHALARGVSPAYTQFLLSAISIPTNEVGTAATGGPHLTSREEVILRLLASGLRTRDVADHLFISPATVKRHVANIYLKLGVSHKTAALARAAELRLI